MSELPSTPRPRLPREVILLVFEQADPSTLAVLGRVSYDFLASSSPLLYRSVTIRSVKALEGLFCEREEPKMSASSRIDSILSLSQIRTFVFVFISPSSSNPSSLHLSFSRLDGLEPLPLDNLQTTSFLYQGLYASLYSNLFPRFNPIRFKLTLMERGGSFWVELGEGPLLSAWDRLQEVEMEECLPLLSSLDGRGLFLAGLPRPSLARRRVVRIDLAIVASSFYSTSLLIRIGRGHGIFALDQMQDGSIVVVVKSREEKRKMEEAIRTNEEVARWRHVFAVEVGTS